MSAVEYKRAREEQIKGSEKKEGNSECEGERSRMKEIQNKKMGKEATPTCLVTGHTLIMDINTVWLLKEMIQLNANSQRPCSEASKSSRTRVAKELFL